MTTACQSRHGREAAPSVRRALTGRVRPADDEAAQTEHIRFPHRAVPAAAVPGLGRACAAPTDSVRRAAERRGPPMAVPHHPFAFAFAFAFAEPDRSGPVAAGAPEDRRRRPPAEPEPSDRGAA
ncbi:hypothetical protein [Streptomyces sp. SCL15-4]|uniref:hypothetical protein n=1 Tax=Streptomyces sp. SCL15-4 TaxID=2967221 RepID=UPI0029667DAB|nr:hypothetical protein [Streptomyces sp. SCL15-4]